MRCATRDLYVANLSYALPLLLEFCLLVNIVAAEPVQPGWSNEAKGLYASGKVEEAIGLATKAIEANVSDTGAYLLRGQFHDRSRHLQKALADYNQALKLDTNLAQAWQLRGLVQFRLAKVKEALADFDRFLELMPDQAPYHWQRGIACYYAGRFEDGRKQFELHRKVNPEDVENAVWHFLCVARSSSVEKARELLMPIKNDERVPMSQIYSLFAGKVTPEDVLRATEAGEPPPSELRRRLFYAHLYIGLYLEAIRDRAAYEHIAKAASDYAGGDYMSDVARLHIKLSEGSRR